jgi:hypothetical protein
MLDRKLSKFSFNFITRNISINISQHDTTIADIFADIINFMFIFLEATSYE